MTVYDGCRGEKLNQSGSGALAMGQGQRAPGEAGLRGIFRESMGKAASSSRILAVNSL